MATRFYFRENGIPPITPSVSGWSGGAGATSPFDRKPMFTTTDASDTLTTVTGFSANPTIWRCHRQLISEPMNAGFVFDTTVSYKCYVQAYESTATDDLRSRFIARILSQDGTIQRIEPLPTSDWSNGAEWDTALRNKTFCGNFTGNGSYTNVSGDRLVIELGHYDPAGVSTNSGSSRWGSAGLTDLGENDTSTSTTERPWFECSLNLTFLVIMPSMIFVSG